jgi:hypothetical protein
LGFPRCCAYCAPGQAFSGSCDLTRGATFSFSYATMAGRFATVPPVVNAGLAILPGIPHAKHRYRCGLFSIRRHRPSARSRVLPHADVDYGGHVGIVDARFTRDGGTDAPRSVAAAFDSVNHRFEVFGSQISLGEVGCANRFCADQPVITIKLRHEVKPFLPATHQHNVCMS